jgi:DNA invertase Pin-like site-specific DNA recombinase
MGRRKSAQGPAAKGDPRRAVAYLRVSTDEQTLGPEAQRAAIETWAAREGITIASWRDDLGISGAAELTDRPGLEGAISDLRAHNAGVLAVAKRDRLARDLAKVREILVLVHLAGAAVRSADGASDAEGPEGVLLQTMIDAFAEYERLLIRTRTKAALDRKRAKGEAVGRPPYGFRVSKTDGKRLVESPGEQAVIREIVRLKRADAPEREIAEELTRLGHVSRVGKPFLQTQVHRIIARIDPKTWRSPPVFTRKVEPLDNATVDVDLARVLVPFEGAPDPKWNALLARWLEADVARVRVVSIPHFLSDGWRDRAKQVQTYATGRTDAHRWLCALGWLFLREGCGKPAVLASHERTKYSAGVADVAAEDGSMFVECGTLREDKIVQALCGKQVVLVVPYLIREDLSPDLASCFDEVDASAIPMGFMFYASPKGADTIERYRYDRLLLDNPTRGLSARLRARANGSSP